MTEDKGQNNEEVVAIETVEVSEKFAKAGKKSKKHVEEVKAEEERKARAAENKLAELEVTHPWWQGHRRTSSWFNSWSVGSQDDGFH